jgi:hypothetical protein
VSGSYVITYDDGRVVLRAAFVRPDRVPQAGDVYEATQPGATIAPAQYVAGDTFEIMERTHFAPHHRKSELGNLIVRCKHMTSVWTEFDDGVACGRFRLRVPCESTVLPEVD